MSSVHEISPFKFLDSYTAEDSERFFGRNQEVEELYTKVFQSKILLVYGASGTGKSSLVNCGLASRFQKSDWFPISIRRSGNILNSLAYQLQKNCLSSSSNTTKNNWQAKEILPLVHSVFLDHFKPIYLIFDQFEELFIFGEREEWEAFSKSLEILLASDLEIHFIFVVRGDYLEYLSEFEKTIPGFFNNRFRVEKMRLNQAKECISGPCGLAGITLEEGFENALISKLDPKGRRIEPTFLQVFLDRILKKSLAQNASLKELSFTKKSVEDLGQVSDILAEFVDEQIFKMEKPLQAWSILKCFVSLDGTKVPLSLDELQSSLGQIGTTISDEELNLVLEALVNKRILSEKDDEGRQELRHDSLALKIYERISLQEKERLEVQRFLSISLREYQKRGTLLKEEDLDYIKTHQRKLKLGKEMQAFIDTSLRQSKKQRTKKRYQRIVAILILLLALSSLFGLLYSLAEKDRADSAAKLAKRESAKAIVQKENAELQKKRAEESARLAQSEAEKALEAEELARLESIKAREAERRSLTEKNAATLAQKAAVKSEKAALEQKELARKAQAEAERLGKISLARSLALRSLQLNAPFNAQLALQAFALNLGQNAYPDQSDIFSALLNSFDLQKAFMKRQLEEQILKMISLDGKKYGLRIDGSLVVLDENSSEGAKVIYQDARAFTNVSVDPNSKRIILFREDGLIVEIDPKNPNTNNESQISLAVQKDALFAWEGNYYFLSKGSLYQQGNVEKEAKLVYRSNFKAMDFNSQSKTLYLLNSSNELLAWGLKASSPAEIGAIPENMNSLEAKNGKGFIAFSNDEGRVGIFNLNTSEYTQLSSHSSAVSSLCFSSKGSSLASSSYDRSVKIWDLENLLERPREIQNLAYWISAVHFENQHIWLSTFEGHLYHFPIQSQYLADLLCQKDLGKIDDTQWLKMGLPKPTNINYCP
jgi:energy-coupling factor transporter ATP-binding protein EcfA2